MIKRARRLRQGLDYFIDNEALEKRAGIGGLMQGMLSKIGSAKSTGRFWRNTSNFSIL
jgi:hypothetical protein